MLVKTFKWVCDACGKDIGDGYMGKVEYSGPKYDDVESANLDFCKDCMISFNEWRKSRKNSH